MKDQFSVLEGLINKSPDSLSVGRCCQALFNGAFQGLILVPFDNIHDILKVVVKGLPADIAGVHQLFYCDLVQRLVLKELVQGVCDF